MKFEATFGALIAFLLPGFICLYGLSFAIPALAKLMDGTGQTTESAGFLYTILASLSVGLVISAIRWALLDQAFAALDIKWPDNVDWSKLNDEKKMASFQLIVQGHYHHYQYYSNTFVALLIALVVNEIGPTTLGWRWIAGVLVLLILLSGSQDTLQKYYARGSKILS